MQPMLGKPLHRPGWIYEEKCDGWRMLAFEECPRIRLISRQAVDHTDRFRELAPRSPR
jgi:ATP-dependent DNA ligase